MPYYGPQDESPKEIFLERTFLAGDFICGTGYGAQLVLYTSCATFLWNTRKIRRQSIYLLAYITLLILIETLFMIVQARTVQDIYIDNRNYPGGPWVYFLATQHLPINVAFYASFFALTFLSDLLVLWRCWVIWSASKRSAAYAVVAFPAVLLLVSFVMGTLWAIESSEHGLSLYSPLPQAYGTSYYVISLCVNIILTILIAVRLIMYRRTLLATLSKEQVKHYVSLAAIIIESAALYSVLAFIFIVTYAINNPINQIFLGATNSGQQIAGFLIIYRLAEGHGWNTDTLKKHAQTLPPMQFASNTTDALSTVQLDTAELLSPAVPSYATDFHIRDDSTLQGSPTTLKRLNNSWSGINMRSPAVRVVSLP